ncbi:hypothetical protein OF83DRAFT_1260044 [Amylostereum chailletii]|nr:hypothetical protein OF83DRAFT_1260044 [Amylostereum chailletii]
MQQHDLVSGEQYRYALTNFRIAHEKVEEQRGQLEQQEKQVALLRERIATLEGTSAQVKPGSQRQGGSSVDDFSIKVSRMLFLCHYQTGNFHIAQTAASKLERLINRWATDLIRQPPASLDDLRAAALTNLTGEYDSPDEARAIVVQNLLRHAMAETISDGIINALIVTNSSEANVHLTRIHEHIFARDPTVASVWRRQTFSAAVEAVSPQMSQSILQEHIPSLLALLPPPPDPDAKSTVVTSAFDVLDSGYEFSRMLHGSPSTAGGTIDAFYRSFVPELGSTLYPRQIELVKRCKRSERGEIDRVGATIFPGLVKVSKAPGALGAQPTDNLQTVVRRAQVICECALTAGPNGPPGSPLAA